MPPISVMTMVFGGLLAEGKLSDTEMLCELELMGMDGVELWADHLLESPKRSRAYQVFLANSTLRVTCIDAIGNFATGDSDRQRANLERVHRTLALAYAMNCPLVLTAGSRLEPGVSPEDGRKRIAEALNEAMPAARQAGVTLCIEDFGIEPTLQCSAADCGRVLDAVDGLAFTFDSGNFYFAQEDPMANLDLLWPRVRHIHLKDWSLSEQPEIADVAACPVGSGLIPNRRLVKRAIASDYRGAFSLETSGPGDRMQAVRADLATVRDWL